MTPQDYTARRAKLISEYNFMLRKRLLKCAAARVRQIAELDHDYDGTPIKKTKALFHYDDLMNPKAFYDKQRNRPTGTADGGLYDGSHKDRQHTG